MLVALVACNLKDKNQTPGYFIPTHSESKTIDTSFTDGPSNYHVEILEQYTSRTPPSRTYKDKDGKDYYKYYRDLDFNINVSVNGQLKFTKKGMNIKDFAKDLPKAILDSGILSPIVFKYYPESNLLVFLTRTRIPGAGTETGSALILDKDFKPSYVVGGK
jgi:hypothetical protein